VPQKDPISHHPQPLILTIAIALITMSNSILRMPTSQLLLLSRPPTRLTITDLLTFISNG
jgi:hypothetical protein